MRTANAANANYNIHERGPNRTAPLLATYLVMSHRGGFISAEPSVHGPPCTATRASVTEGPRHSAAAVGERDSLFLDVTQIPKWLFQPSVMVLGEVLSHLLRHLTAFLGYFAPKMAEKRPESTFGVAERFF